MLGASVASRSFDDELTAIVGPRRWSRSSADRIAYARDLWPRTLLAIRDGDPAPTPPDLVVWPESTPEVARIVTLAAAHRVPLVPFGAGSGVCGGATAPHGGMILDMKRMSSFVALDEDALTATFETGINGEHLERALAARGYTLGHFPSSIYCSTLGGWLAARSAGQLSTRYGKIEDMALGLTAVTGTGEILETGRRGRAGRGPDWTQIFIGSEGTLGVITRARLRVHPAPEVRILRGIAFPRVAAGCEAIRRLLQRGLRPAVVRLYDELDTLMASRAGDEHDQDGTSLVSKLTTLLPDSVRESVPGLRRRLVDAALSRSSILNSLADTILPRALSSAALLIVGFEGARRVTEAEARAGLEELRRAGGRDLGEAPGRHWFENRYKVSYRQSLVFMNGAWVDTMEVATTWDRLLDLYHEVKRAVAPHAFVMAHFSHGYAEGCSIYFTFAGGGSTRAAAERRYDSAWRAALSAVLRVGATLSHHHGIGRSKASFLPEEHRDAFELLRALKATFDPHGVLNPGSLGLGSVTREAPSSLPSPTPPSGAADLVGRIEQAVGVANVSTTATDLVPFGASDSNAVLCRPGSGAEVAEVVRACRDAGARLLAVGAGSLRAPAAAVSAAGSRRVILCDTRRMTNVLHLDETSLTVHVQAGITGRALEALLVPRGLTLGDHPPAALDSTIGGLLATRAPGRASPRHGLLEDACLGISAVLGDGRTIHTRVTPRRATGPDLARVVLGGEGRSALITAATLRVFRRPDVLLLEGFELPALTQAVRATRLALRAGVRPAALRIIDAAPGDAELPAGGALVLCAVSGVAEPAAAEQAELRRAIAQCGGRPAAAGTAESWWRRRQAADHAALEVLVPAAHLVAVVAAVRAAVQAAGGQVRHAHLARFTSDSACAYFNIEGALPDELRRIALRAGERAGALPGDDVPAGDLAGAPLEAIRVQLERRLDPHRVLHGGAEGKA